MSTLCIEKLIYSEIYELNHSIYFNAQTLCDIVFTHRIEDSRTSKNI